MLYLDEDSIALKYTDEDNVVSGYTIHVFGVCLEPALVELYASDDAAGRGQMLGLTLNQAFGRARGDQVLIAVARHRVVHGSEVAEGLVVSFMGR